ncbi:HNH endonuclease [Candidatus Zixiibacteriota bacterium]
MDSSRGRRWSREELLIAFNFYCRTPFGKYHKTNPTIIKLANLLNRTPDALAMKLGNFASLDPFHKARNIKGLRNVSRADRLIWDEFHNEGEKLAIESQSVIEELSNKKTQLRKIFKITQYGSTITETVKETKVRLAQSFFRDIVLASYGYECAICQLNLIELLNASHIIPWSYNPLRRADPTNGLALCALHDRAFDRGFFTFNTSLRVIISSKIKAKTNSRLQIVALQEINGIKMMLPGKFTPDETAIKFHRENVFVP